MGRTEETWRTSGGHGRHVGRRGFDGVEAKGSLAVLGGDGLMSSQMMGEGEHPLYPDLTRRLRDSSRGAAAVGDLQGLRELASPDQEGIEMPEEPDLVVRAAQRSGAIDPARQRTADIIHVAPREHRGDG